MFTSDNREDNSKFSLGWKDDNQMYQTSASKILYQLSDDPYFVLVGTYDEDEFVSQTVLRLRTLADEKIRFQTLFNSEFQSAIKFFVELLDTEQLLRFAKARKALGNPDITPKPLSWFVTPLPNQRHSWDYTVPAGRMRSIVKKNGMIAPNSRLFVDHEDSERYDDLVDRYHNNVHFMHFMAQLLCDLILFRLPTSVHSQCTMLGAFAARSSQVDYGEKKKLEDFCLTYQSSSALDYYTRDMFFYRVLNYVLRQQRYDIIYQYRQAIIDVIERLRQPLPSDDDSVSLVLYRGQRMTIFELEKMKNNVGEVISTSSFLSTTMNPQIAQIFAGDGSDDNPCLISVIFKIHLDTGQPMRPYALINKSAEEEVLFTPGTKFVLISCRKLHDNGRLWLLELNAIPEKQQEQLELNHGETFMLLSSARGWPTSVVVVHHLIT